MNSVVLCYARPDEPFVRDLAGYLERNLPLAFSSSEAIVGPHLDLIEATERALSADAAIVLLSPHSVPKVWNRQLWEPVFVDKPKEFQTHLGFVLVSACKFPEVLRRSRFFDASSDPLSAQREIKRWLLRPITPVRQATPVPPELEDLRQAVADKPGVALDVNTDQAIQFTDHCGSDFDAVYRLDLRRRSRAGIMGDVRSAAGLPCSGRTQEDDASWSSWCSNHRALYVLAGVNPEDRDSIQPHGRTSVIFTEPLDAFLPGAISSDTAGAVRRFDESLPVDPAAAIRLGWEAVNLLKMQSRPQEVLEVLEAMARLLRSRGDASALTRVEREQYWTRVYQGDESVTLFEVPDFAGPEQQMRFDFEAA